MLSEARYLALVEVIISPAGAVRGVQIEQCHAVLRDGIELYRLPSHRLAVADDQALAADVMAAAVELVAVIQRTIALPAAPAITKGV